MSRFAQLLFITCFMFGLNKIYAQNEATFTTNVSTDSVLAGNYFTVTFMFKGGEAEDFQAPDFSVFEVLSGPNYSSQISVVNGAMSQILSYSYMLKPIGIGEYYLDPAFAKVAGEAMESKPILISVFPNPDGIDQNATRQRNLGSDFWDDNSFFNFDFSFPEWMEVAPEQSDSIQQKTRKRKTTKI